LWIRYRLSLLREVWLKLNKDNGALLAAAVSFYGFLSLFPLLLLAVGILGFVLKSPAHAEAILTPTISHYIVGPQLSGIMAEIIHGRSAATGVGFLLLVWSGMSAVVVLEQAVNLAWEAPQRRTFIGQRLVALVTLVVAGVLLLVSFGTTTALHAARTASPEFLAKLSFAWTLLGYCIAAFFSIVPFVLLYKLLPNARVRWSTALAAGIFTGVLWELAKQIFTYFVLHWAGYNRIYGSLSSVILLMIWIYYSSIITILGAEFGVVWSGRASRQYTGRQQGDAGLQKLQ